MCTKVHAKGFRNPFRFTLMPGGGVAVADVGWESSEELNVVRPGRLRLAVLGGQRSDAWLFGPRPLRGSLRLRVHAALAAVRL